ncbi:hypothetical protein T8J41_18600 [Nitratireductor rhodophyticola]|uniref:hypothetical protein n=1 Tax=Nitratireductor rhodophyticola TaxID=2854036 RepID=UPI002AC8FFE4|nr:hypothetical protein [Nitratireductor rhodophyticola]WPZ14114.1 hypothetical protein T8J41_18600 [Nitratireductor rhodophyticola]
MSLALTPTLRKTLRFDAAMSGGAALLLVVAAGPLSRLLALPEALLFWAGVVLVPFVTMLLVIAARAKTPRLVLIDIVLLNAVWVVASFALLASGWVAPNPLGIAFVYVQAVAVAVFALLQLAALRAAQN